MGVCVRVSCTRSVYVTRMRRRWISFERHRAETRHARSTNLVREEKRTGRGGERKGERERNSPKTPSSVGVVMEGVN